MKIHIHLILFISIFLGGCATRKEIIPLRPDIKPLIHSSEINLVKCEDKMVCDINVCSSGSGLISLLIDGVVNSYRENRAEKTAKDMHDIVKSYRTNDVIMRELKEITRKVKWLNTKKISIIDKNEGGERERFLSKNTHIEVQGIVDFRYSMSPDFDTLTATANVSFYPVGASLKRYLKATKSAENPILKFKAQASHTLKFSEDDLYENADRWNANEGKRLRAALAEVTQKVMKQIQMMLMHPEALDEE